MPSPRDQSHGPRSTKIGRLRLLKRQVAAKLKRLPNVTGVGVGYKEVANKRTGTVCLRVYVKNKRPRNSLKPSERVPNRIGGFLTDVIEDRFRIHLDHSVRMNPLLGGISVGNSITGGSGTLGGSVFDRRTRRDLLLSNWHVLCGRVNCKSGERIIQPGTGGGDSGTGADIIARLERWALTAEVDAAIGRISGHRFLLRQLFELGYLRGLRPAELGLTVSKSGRTTGITTGRITDIDADIEIDGYPTGARTFEHQLLIEDGNWLSKPGDSGSIWVDGNGLAVGLLFAGSKRRTIANQMTVVAQALNLEFAFGVTTQDIVALDLTH